MRRCIVSLDHRAIEDRLERERAPRRRPARAGRGAAPERGRSACMIRSFLFEFGTLFAIINPYGLSFIFLNRTMSLSDAERRIVARQVAMYAFAVLIASFFAGTI